MHFRFRLSFVDFPRPADHFSASIRPASLRIHSETFAGLRLESRGTAGRQLVLLAMGAAGGGCCWRWMMLIAARWAGRAPSLCVSSLELGSESGDCLRMFLLFIAHPPSGVILVQQPMRPPPNVRASPVAHWLLAPKRPTSKKVGSDAQESKRCSHVSRHIPGSPAFMLSN